MIELYQDRLGNSMLSAKIARARRRKDRIGVVVLILIVAAWCAIVFIKL